MFVAWLVEPEASGVVKFFVDLPNGRLSIKGLMSTPLTQRPSSALTYEIRYQSRTLARLSKLVLLAVQRVRIASRSRNWGKPRGSILKGFHGISCCMLNNKKGRGDAQCSPDADRQIGKDGQKRRRRCAKAQKRLKYEEKICFIFA